MTIYYPDVSSYQAGVSFAGVPIAVVKATEGTDYTNPDYAAAGVRAKAAGAYFVAYHFLHSGNMAAQAAHAYSVVGKTPLMIDMESTTDSNPTLTDLAAFIGAYRALGGITYLLYLPHWYWQDIGSPSLEAFPWMLLVSSNYTSYNDDGVGWDAYGGKTPFAWQYTDAGSLNGINGVDFNAYKGTLVEYKSYVETGKAPGPGPKPIPPPKPTTEPVVSYGSVSPAIKVLQTQLNDDGAKLVVDGNFGDLTLAAVKAFQASHKLVVDGIVGPKTWAALGNFT